MLQLNRTRNCLRAAGSGPPTIEVVACVCVEGWRCERHPDRGWPHDDCDDAGIVCSNPACEAWQTLRHQLAARRLME